MWSSTIQFKACYEISEYSEQASFPSCSSMHHVTFVAFSVMICFFLSTGKEARKKELKKVLVGYMRIETSMPRNQVSAWQHLQISAR